jgi:hypothetical protein
MKSTRICSVCGNTQCSFDAFSTLTIDLPIPETVGVEVEVFWRRKPRTIYGLMVPRDCKVDQVREALQEQVGLAVERQLVVRLSYRENAFQSMTIPDNATVVAGDRLRLYEVEPMVEGGARFAAMHRRLLPREGYFLNEFDPGLVLCLQHSLAPDNLPAIAAKSPVSTRILLGLPGN